MNTAPETHMVHKNILSGIFVELGVISLLLIAVGAYGNDVDKGFYDFLRLCITTAAAVFAYRAHQSNRKIWLATMCGLALMYNPVFRIHLSSREWVVVNLVAIAVFAFHAVKITASTHPEAGKTILSYAHKQAKRITRPSVAAILLLLALPLLTISFNKPQMKNPPALSQSPAQQLALNRVREICQANIVGDKLPEVVAMRIKCESTGLLPSPKPPADQTILTANSRWLEEYNAHQAELSKAFWEAHPLGLSYLDGLSGEQSSPQH